jgi:hypothetical protein
LLGFDATGISETDSPVDGDGVGEGDGEVGVRAGGEDIDGLGVGLMLGLELGLSGGSDAGEEIGEGVCGMMGAGAGAWDRDIVTRAREIARRSVARVSAIVAEGRRRKCGSEEKQNRAEQWDVLFSDGYIDID